jgi:hypothetical protein
VQQGNTQGNIWQYYPVCLRVQLRQPALTVPRTDFLLLYPLCQLIVCALLGIQGQTLFNLTPTSIDLIPARYVLQERTKASLEVLRALRVLLAKRPWLEALPRAIVVTS